MKSEEAVTAAVSLIQSQVDAGVIHAATLYVRIGDMVKKHSFGAASSTDTIFLLASITKTMSAAGVMALVEERALDLSDRVMKFFPEFTGDRREEITIHHLLTHTSGLPDQLPENAELRKRHAPLSEFVERTLRTPLLFKPGTRYSYQSMGILLAAEIAQRITGTPFPDFLSERIFRPLGMKHTALGLGEIPQEDTVQCQTEDAAPEAGSGSAEAKNWDWNSSYWRNLGAPWGGAHGTAADVARFLESFLHPDGSAVHPDTAREMIRNHNEGLDTSRGLGFALGPSAFVEGCSDKAFGHGGATGTLAWADPPRDRVCVILTSLPANKSRSLISEPVSELISAAE